MPTGAFPRLQKPRFGIAASLTKKSRSKRYLILIVAIAAFSVTLTLGFTKIFYESSREQAQSKELIFWSATQIEHEYWRLLDALSRYHQSDGALERDDLLLRLDILWSRINISENGDIGRRIRAIEGNGAAIDQLKYTLETVEPLILALEKGDGDKIAAVRGKLEPHSNNLYQLTERTTHYEQDRSFLFKQRTAQTYLLSSIFFLGVLISGGVLIILLLNELKRSKRLLDTATEAEKKTQESEKKFRDYAKSSSDWFWETDRELRFTHLSREFFERNAIDPDTILGKSFHELEGESSDGQKNMHLLDHADQRPFRDIRSHWHLPGRGLLEFSVSGVPILAPDGRLTGYRGTMSDITERLRIDAQLARTGKMESLGLLSGGVAHEFNNLLSLIGGFAGIAKRHPDDPERVAEALDTIIQSTEQGSNLTKQMLAFSRKGDLEAKSVSVNELVRNIEAMIKPLTSEKISVRFDIPETDKCIHIDPSQLSQAVLNLAINARDAMCGGGNLTIGTEIHEFPGSRRIGGQFLAPGKYVAIYVEDTGPGIEPSILEHIFEPFFTTKGPDKGTGLGLSIIYGLMGESGGAIDVESKLGEGSRFTLYLPEAEALGEEVSASGQTVRHSNNTALVAEAHDGIRRLLSQTIEKLGYRVLFAKDGDEAIKLSADHAGAVDLLLTSVSLPGTNGGALARELGADNDSLKVIYFAQRGEDDELPNEQKNAHSRVIHKPFDPDFVVETVNDLMAS